MKIKNKSDKNLKLEVFSITNEKDNPIKGSVTLKAGKEMETEFPLDELRIKIIK